MEIYTVDEVSENLVNIARSIPIQRQVLALSGLAVWGSAVL